ncbi:acetate kinase [Pseudoxanthomonas sp. SGD-10]|nr:acetate kinase [Pseudoxanthomonas sp. SGD-10]
MNIIIINSGSSSIKYQLFKMPSEQPICSGIAERIGLENASITHKVFGSENKSVQINADLPNHESAMLEIEHLLTQPETGVIHDPSEIEIVGHRVVHGGESFSETTLITEEVKEQIKKLYPLAPLHNPGHYAGIVVAEKLFKNAVQIAVFDTAFHQTMPEKAFRYAIPNEYYKDLKIRSYGFHGTSHKYVAKQAADYLGKSNSKIITIHLGNGCSMSAVDDGKCIDTSMGLTPLDGLIMGTRSGQIDASVLLYIMKQKNYDVEQTDKLLNKESGMLGLTGYSDMRDIKKALENGDESAKLAYDMYSYRIKKYIGSYAAALNGLDAIVFTAGVGENDSLTRELVCKDLEFFGIEIDTDKNKQRESGLREINSANSRVKILVIPTNEELEIANQCQVFLENHLAKKV